MSWRRWRRITGHPSMATEAGAPSKRPNPILLALLGLTIVVAAIAYLMNSAGSGPGASNPRGAQRVGATAPSPSGRKGDAIDPGGLDVHLEALEAERPAAARNERNPFRFRPAPAPPPPPPTPRPAQ